MTAWARTRGGLLQRRGEQLHVIVRHAGLGDLHLIAGTFLAVVGGVGVGRIWTQSTPVCDLTTILPPLSSDC